MISMSIPIKYIFTHNNDKYEVINMKSTMIEIIQWYAPVAVVLAVYVWSFGVK